MAQKVSRIIDHPSGRNTIVIEDRSDIYDVGVDSRRHAGYPCV